MIEDYGKLPMFEIRSRAKEGDAKAKQMLDEIYTDIQSMINDLPPNSIGAYLMDVTRFKWDRDMDAVRRLAENQYATGKFLHPNRKQALRNSINQRHSEENAHEDYEKNYHVWWIDNIMISALALELFRSEINGYRVTDVYPITRNAVRQEVEKDLTGGHTADSKDFNNISATDYEIGKEQKGTSSDGRDIDMDGFEIWDQQAEQVEQAEKNDYMNSGNERDKSTIRGIEDETAVRLALKKLTPRELFIVQQPLLCDAKRAAKKLGISYGAFLTERSRIMSKVRQNNL